MTGISKQIQECEALHLVHLLAFRHTSISLSLARFSSLISKNFADFESYSSLTGLL